MACRPLQTSMLLVVVVSAMATGVEQPRSLSDRQVDAIKAALDDPSTQLATLKWLGGSSSTSEQLLDPVSKFLTHPQAEIQQAAAEVMAKIRDMAAAEAKAKIRDMSGTTPIEKGLKEAVDWVMGHIDINAAAEAMAENPDKLVPDIIDLLRDPEVNAIAKQAMAKALGMIGEKAAQAVPALVELLRDPKADYTTKQAAAEALGKIGDKAALAAPALINLFQDPRADGTTKQAAAEALGKIGDKAVLGHIDLPKSGNDSDRMELIQSILKQMDQRRTPLDNLFRLLSILDDSRSRQRISRWVRAGAEATPAQFCWALEAAFSRREGREERRLDAYLTASAAERPLVRWLADRYEEFLPWDTLDHAQLVELMRNLANLLPFASETPKCKAEIADRILYILRKASWSRSDLEALREVKKLLEEGNLDASFLQNLIDQLELWQKAIHFITSGIYFLAAHVVFWAGLIFLYPRFRWVQAFFFWNPWVRTITGLVYVPWLITLLPFLRRRLLSPFRDNLVPRSFADEFREDSYYAGSKMTSLRDGKEVERLASEDLTPPLTGMRVIEAPSGFGKTTLLRRFVTLAQRPVVFLRATECEKGVAEAVQQRLLGIAADRKFLQTLVYSGGLDVLIDGLNEAGPETRGLISVFVNKHFKGNYVLTTQPLPDAHGLPGAAERWRLQPLDPDAVETFLSSQWVRVELLAQASGVDRSQYDVAVKQVLDEFQESLDESDELCQFGPRTPMDATLIAELIAQGVEPDPNNLIAQYVGLTRDRYRDLYPGREPRFRQIGARALKAMQDQAAHIDFSDLVEERKVLDEKRLLLPRDGQWVFRHDRIRDYFIALSQDKKGALRLRHDARFTGVFEFLPILLPEDDVNELGEILRAGVLINPNSIARPVWQKFQQNWSVPDVAAKIEGYVTRATNEFLKNRPAEDPRYKTVGARAFAALEKGHSWIDLQGLDAEQESLVAANILRDRNGQIEFRTDELRDYFVAMSLDKDKAFAIRVNESFFGLFEFLPKFLSREDVNDLGKKLKDDYLTQGKPKSSAWHRYKKHWREPRKAGR
jgi:hypothetical protein